jgi:uncharacterized protein YqgV (UPF0045/DUF77 family)
MKLTIEISMYPIRDDYLPPIDEFIAELNEDPAFIVETTPTATRVLGDFDPLMNMLRDAMKASYEAFGTSVFVTKFIPGYEVN